VLGHPNGHWQGRPPTGRHFERIAEVYFFELLDGRIIRAWGLGDNLSRMQQLGYG
jgi:predicted ester cyclase